MEIMSYENKNTLLIQFVLPFVIRNIIWCKLHAKLPIRLFCMWSAYQRTMHTKLTKYKKDLTTQRRNTIDKYPHHFINSWFLFGPLQTSGMYAFLVIIGILSLRINFTKTIRQKIWCKAHNSDKTSLIDNHYMCITLWCVHRQAKSFIN